MAGGRGSERPENLKKKDVEDIWKLFSMCYVETN